jgi:hypothetical protein
MRQINQDEFGLERNEVQFKHLSGWLKTAVICMWILLGIFGLAFMIGFLGAMTEVA